MKEQIYGYFAFISYKREDEEWAKWLQYEFEHYKLPSTLNGRKDIPNVFRPIFRDTEELSAGNLPRQIHEALKASAHLVVVCSPQSAQSEWVNKEINEYITIGKEIGINNVDRIFPFIVGGQPHAKNPAEECFPESIRTISKDQERIGGNINETGRDKAFVKILSGMIGVRFNELWNRYEREKIEQEQQKREERNRLLILESRFLSEKARDLVEKGDSYLAQLLALEALPKKLGDCDERPYCQEAEATLRIACDKNSAIIHEDVSAINHLCFNPNGEQLVSVADNTISIWDVKTGTKKHTFIEPGTTFRFENCITLVEYAIFSPSGEQIISAAEDDTVRIWDIDTGQEKCLFEGHIVACSPNGELIATVTLDEHIHIWNVETGKELQKINGHPKIERARNKGIKIALATAREYSSTKYISKLNSFIIDRNKKN